MQFSIDKDLDKDVKDIADEINSYSQTIYLVLQLCDDLNIIKPASPAINFRDAINHYVLLYEAYEKNDVYVFISQISSITEHLNRGIKDTIIHFLSNINVKLFALISNPVITKKTLQIELRKYFHIFKNIILKIRLGSINIERLDDNVVISEIKDHIKKMKLFMDSNDLYRLFIKRYNNY